MYAISAQVVLIPLCAIDRAIEAGEEILHSYGDLSRVCK